MAPEIWMAAAEARPLAQTGGLADVLRALPEALARGGHAVRRFLPAYTGIDRTGFEPEAGELDLPLGPARAPARFSSRREPSGVVTTLVENAELFGREGIYGPPGGEYADNARRFTFFARAIVERCARAEPRPGVLHVHDWHAALVPLLVRFMGEPGHRPRSVLTIHNLGYQGEFPASEIEWLSLPGAIRDEVFQPDGIEFYGGISFLKAGILYADALTTVSPTYAKEILTPEHGCRLDGLLRWQVPKLHGILNGADYELWDPARDPHLPETYSASTLERKASSRRALRERLGLPPSERPILGVVSRLVHQKGIDVAAAAAEKLLECGADLVVLGSGERGIVDPLESLRTAHPERIALYIGYNDALSHLVVAGSDLILLPSRYEPCGLTQMYAMRYGTLPIVTRTGGLADTVRDASDPSSGTGFFLNSLSPEALEQAVKRALGLRHGDPATWKRLQLNAMAQDFSWDLAAARYADLYEQISK